MEYIRVSAKTVADAVIEASIQLETSSDNIEYEVLEKESAGFLGFGKKPAIIRARKKETAQVDLEEEIKKPEPAVTVKPAAEPRDSFKPREKQPVSAKAAKPVRTERPEKTERAERTDRPVKETSAAVPAREKAPVDKEEVIRRAEEFLGKTLKAMGMEVNIKCSFDEEDSLNIELDGGDMGILIGKRGQTLDSLQYLANRVANKHQEGYVRVKLDTENYRARREETLRHLAKNIAHKVKRNRRPVALEPMNPYERRIIHSALQSDPYVMTHSEGEEPFRKVVITLKK